MKIAILGSASSSLPHAPFKDSAYEEWVQGKAPSLARAHAQISGDWDIWGCSPGCWAVSPRFTRFFEVHRWEPGKEWFSPEYCQFLRDFKGIVYTGAAIPEIPNHVIYPIDYIEERFSSYFLTSSLALMQAQAIDTIEQIRRARHTHRQLKWAAERVKARIEAGLPEPNTEVDTAAMVYHRLPEGVNQAELEKDDHDDVIGLWGVDMAAGDEYAYQRPGCQFFVLEAMRRGIGVFLPPESDLMRPKPVYGISEWDHNYIKLTSRAREINAKSQMAQQQIQSASNQLAGLQGENHALNYFVDTWTSPYGMLPGMVIRQVDENLGSGITSVDGRPIERMVRPVSPVLEAMTEDPAVSLAKEIMVALRPHAGETGLSEGAVDVVKRLGAEGAVGRTLTSHLQQFAHQGESTEQTLKRVLAAAVGAKRAGAKARRKKRR